VCLLPALLKGAELRPAQWPLRIAKFAGTARSLLNTPDARAAGAAVPSAPAACCSRKQKRHSPVGRRAAALTEEAQAVARITGYQPTSQFFLVRATNQQNCSNARPP
jgi:hypothetical protein